MKKQIYISDKFKEAIEKLNDQINFINTKLSNAVTYSKQYTELLKERITLEEETIDLINQYLKLD